METLQTARFTWQKLKWQFEIWNSKLRSFLLGDEIFEKYLQENSKEEQVFWQIVEELQDENLTKKMLKHYENIKTAAMKLIEMKKKGYSFLEMGKVYKKYEEQYCLPFKQWLEAKISQN